MKIISIILLSPLLWAQNPSQDAPPLEKQATITTKKSDRVQKSQEIPTKQRVVFKFLDNNENLIPAHAQLVTDGGETIDLVASEGIYEKVLESKVYELHTKIDQRENFKLTIDLASELMPMVLIRFNNL